MTRFYFDEDNIAYTLGGSVSNSTPVNFLFYYEIIQMKDILNDLPVKLAISSDDHGHMIKVSFENKADEAFFRILVADGIEI